MQSIQERPVGKGSGFLFVFLSIIILAVGVYEFVLGCIAADSGFFTEGIPVGVTLMILFFCLFNGFFIVHPNEAKVFNLFGKYIGSCTQAGFYFTNPFTTRVKVSLKVNNFSSDTIKVNDLAGNPIEIAAVIVWQVEDSAKATFDVENYGNFVVVQSETAIRNLANHFSYDSQEADIPSLRGNPEVVTSELTKQLQARLNVAGITIVEARISHLAYAPEIAQVMLRRQQAAAVIAARRLIVDGAVGMVQMALTSLEEQGVVKLDEDKRAAMVNNLLVALVSESEAQPIINTGTLFN